MRTIDMKFGFWVQQLRVQEGLPRCVYVYTVGMHARAQAHASTHACMCIQSMHVRNMHMHIRRHLQCHLCLWTKDTCVGAAPRAPP